LPGRSEDEFDFDTAALSKSSAICVSASRRLIAAAIRTGPRSAPAATSAREQGQAQDAEGASRTPSPRTGAAAVAADGALADVQGEGQDGAEAEEAGK